jgi:nicotinamide-nucleotide amidase
MPIHQEPIETHRGMEACRALGVEHVHQDLSDAYDHMVATLQEDTGTEVADKIRRGNIRARLRMITLYNLAAARGGFVASTDNYSELAMGFWTLHGDVGDVSPIQSLSKSWEVPAMARLRGVPESIWRATPTDGLGIAAGDEAQFGFSYLELDLMLFSLTKTNINGMTMDLATGDPIEFIKGRLNLDDEHASQIFDLVVGRLKGSWFKRTNPINIKHPIDDRRYSELEQLDWNYLPEVLGG